MDLGAVKYNLNNEIILFKHPLNQAKVHTISKLTRKIKELRSKNGPENVKEQNKQKAESLLPEISMIKKIKPKELVIFALKCDEDVSKYISKADSSIEQKSMAKLLIHKALNNSYKVLRQRYSEINIDDLLLTKKEKVKAKLKKKKKAKKTKLKEKTPLNLKENETNDDDEQNVNDLKEVNSESENTLLNLKENETNDDDEQNVNDLKEVNSESENTPLNLKENETNDDDEQNVNDLKEVNSESETEDLESIQNNSNDKLIDKNINIAVPFHKSENPKISRNKPIKADKNEKAEFNELPKFNKLNTLQNNLDEENRKPSLDDSYSKKTKVVNLLNNKEDLNHEKKNNAVNENVPKKYSKAIAMVENVIDNDIKAVPVRIDSFFVTERGYAYKTLTESRPRDEIKEFDGFSNRKMRRAAKFNIPLKPRPKINYDDFRKFSVKEPKSLINSKLKDVQGKRYEKHTMSKPIENKEAQVEKLHPSWAAKKMQSGIPEFKGKKIVFGDDL